MTLVESVFKRSKQQRDVMTFADIAKETSVLLTEVEHLVMKALSLGLIKGKIDEANSIVAVFFFNFRSPGSNLVFSRKRRFVQSMIVLWNGAGKLIVVFSVWKRKRCLGLRLFSNSQYISEFSSIYLPI
jgi:hypothetical protein